MEKHKLKVHGELLSTPPMQKRCWIQEVILYATAGTPWSTIGVSEHEQSPGEFRDRADTIENTTKGLLTAPSRKHVQLPPHSECPIYTAFYYLLSPGVSFQ